jgi:hypothetical protein
MELKIVKLFLSFTPFLISPKGEMISSFPLGGRLGRGLKYIKKIFQIAFSI